MRAIDLPNGNLLIPDETEATDHTAAGHRLHEIRPDGPAYRRWRAVAEDGEDPRRGGGSLLDRDRSAFMGAVPRPGLTSAPDTFQI
jgi:hypothetical protein